MQEVLVYLLQDYKIVAPIIFVIIRSSSIIIPPIPGIVFDLAGILVFGPFWGFILAEAGTMLGAMTAFYIARKFREPLVKRIAVLKKVEEWESALSKNKKFWALVAIRLPTNSLFDYISYAAGLTKISALRFFFSTLLGNIPATFCVYYFGGLFFAQGIYYLILFLVILFILWLLFHKKLFTIFHQRFLQRG